MPGIVLICAEQKDQDIHLAGKIYCLRRWSQTTNVYVEGKEKWPYCLTKINFWACCKPGMEKCSQKLQTILQSSKNLTWHACLMYFSNFVCLLFKLICLTFQLVEITAKSPPIKPVSDEAEELHIEAQHCVAQNINSAKAHQLLSLLQNPNIKVS